MKRKTVLLLSCIIVILAVIIAAGVFALYSDGPSDVLSGIVEGKRDKEPLSGTPQADAAAKAEKEIAEAAAKADVAVVADKAEEVPAKAESPVQSFTVKNCSTGRNNTLKQGSDNKLSLIDHTGATLWTIAFPGRILPPVSEIDYYANGKIQFLITEGTALHIIDRLGREVEGYPVQFPRKVTSGPKRQVSGGKTWWTFGTSGSPISFKDKKITAE